MQTEWFSRNNHRHSAAMAELESWCRGQGIAVHAEGIERLPAPFLNELRGMTNRSAIAMRATPDLLLANSRAGRLMRAEVKTVDPETGNQTNGYNCSLPLLQTIFNLHRPDDLYYVFFDGRNGRGYAWMAADFPEMTLCLPPQQHRLARILEEALPSTPIRKLNGGVRGSNNAFFLIEEQFLRECYHWQRLTLIALKGVPPGQPTCLRPERAWFAEGLDFDLLLRQISV